MWFAKVIICSFQIKVSRKVLKNSFNANVIDAIYLTMIKGIVIFLLFNYDISNSSAAKDLCSHCVNDKFTLGHTVVCLFPRIVRREKKNSWTCWEYNIIYAASVFNTWRTTCFKYHTIDLLQKVESLAKPFDLYIVVHYFNWELCDIWNKSVFFYLEWVLQSFWLLRENTSQWAFSMEGFHWSNFYNRNFQSLRS